VRPFEYRAIETIPAATAAVSGSGAGSFDGPPTLADTQFLAGGTTLLDLMKLDVMQPASLVDLTPLERQLGRIEAGDSGLQLGALAHMSAVSEHPQIRRDYPVLAQALQQAASPQLRNMATLAGNVLQRTRCTYFRDVAIRECNKRQPGSGCAALSGCNRKLAVLGVSEHCIAHYPGDLAPALIALDALTDIEGARGQRVLPVEALHRLPGNTPHIETQLRADELIVAFRIPARAWNRRSLYLKIRDRAAYEFALVSVAIALELQDHRVRQARIALGGVASVPWRARQAEALLQDQVADEAHARAAADAEFAGAITHGENDFKPELGRRALVRAILECAALPDLT
jgi:xanthine dehydrogenase YagS FAD-binding subunit